MQEYTVMISGHRWKVHTKEDDSIALSLFGVALRPGTAVIRGSVAVRLLSVALDFSRAQLECREWELELNDGVVTLSLHSSDGDLNPPRRVHLTGDLAIRVLQQAMFAARPTE